MKKYILTTLLTLCVSLCTYAQDKETAWWLFGQNAGLNFNSFKPATGKIITVNGELSLPPYTFTEEDITIDMPEAIKGPLVTREGCFTVSTANGFFLFASSGVDVYNSIDPPVDPITGELEVMKNGSGLLGHNSATQSGIVVPMPGSLTKYYIFTVPEYNLGQLRYSTVDLMANDGKGEVIQKNILLASSATFGGKGVFENIAAVPHANGSDYWLLHRSAQTFYVFEVTATGVTLMPTPASATNVNIAVGVNEFQGEVNISSDFSKIGAVTWGQEQLITANFDNATGIVSDIKVVDHGDQLYALTFSKNSKYVYFTSGFFGGGRLYRIAWDQVRNYSDNTLISTLSDRITQSGFANAVIGLDGRMYGTQIFTTPHDAGKAEAAYGGPFPAVNLPTSMGSIEVPTRSISVLTNPEEEDVSKLQVVYFRDYLLPDTYGLFGLPTFAAGYPQITPEPLPFACAGNPRTYRVKLDPLTARPYKLIWDFGDGKTPVEQLTTQNVYEYTVKYTYDLAKDVPYTVIVIPVRENGTPYPAINMEANVVNCFLKSDKMARIELFNSKEIDN